MTFVILSLKYTRDLWVWWGPNNCGYTSNLDDAGRYTEEQVRGDLDYYNDNESTRAIPVEVAESLKSWRVIPTREEDRLAMASASTDALGEPVARWQRRATEFTETLDAVESGSRALGKAE